VAADVQGTSSRTRGTTTRGCKDRMRRRIGQPPTFELGGGEMRESAQKTHKLTDHLGGPAGSGNSERALDRKEPGRVPILHHRSRQRHHQPIR
jgi:hypothetical protein